MSSRVIIMREATVRIVKMLAEKDVKVTQRGAKAFVEYDRKGKPSRVNIPYLPDDASDELLDAIQGFIDHEVAHILFTDYTALAKANDLGVARLHNIIEDSFIERKMAEHFPGSGMNLRNVGSFFLAKYMTPALAKNPEAAEGILFVPAVRAWAGQTVFIDYMEDKWGMISEVTAILGDAVKEVPKCLTSHDCLAVAVKFREVLEAARPKKEDPAKEPGEEPGEGEEGTPAPEFDPADPKAGKKPEGDSEIEPDPEGKEEGEPSASAETDPEIDPEAAASAPAEPEPESEEAAAPGEGADDEDDEEDTETPSDGGPDDLDMDGDEADGEAPPTTGDTPAPPEAEDAESGEGAAKKDGEGDDDEGPSKMETLESMLGKDFDEALADELTKLSVEDSKSSEYLVYTTELDVIEPMEVDSGRGRWSESDLKVLTDTVDHMIGPLQKDLERAIAARSSATWSAGHRTGRINGAALSRLTSFNDDRVFRRKHVANSKDVAVELLVDCSGSMGMMGKIRTAAYSAYGLASVLERMGIPCEVIGFTTQEDLPAEMYAEEKRLGIKYARHQTLYHPIIKAFNERLTSDTKRRFAALPNVNWLCENVDGESLQIAAHRLAQRRETRKILMVFSDGNPACPGSQAAQKVHLKKTAGQIERSGIDLLAIGINSDAPRHFYKKFLLINDVSELPTTVIGEIKRLLMQ